MIICLFSLKVQSLPPGAMVGWSVMQYLASFLVASH